MDLKIALDFDGVLVDIKENKPLSETAPHSMQSLFFYNNIHVDIVTSRPEINKGYIQRKCKEMFIKNKLIICCGSNKEKIKYLQKSNYDIVVDNDYNILKPLSCEIKILMGEKINNKKVKNIIEINEIEELVNLIKEVKLFSPGPTPMKGIVEMNLSHRCAEFEKIFKKLKDYFERVTKKKVVFTQGSGTSAIETAISSLVNKETRVLILTNGTFGERAYEMVKYYTNFVVKVSTIEEAKQLLKIGGVDIFYITQFETSNSTYNNVYTLCNIAKKGHIISIVDGISSFPFYKIPECDIFITSGSKQLHALPAIGIIFYNKDIVKYLIQQNDYLNMIKYITYAEKNQTPHTTLIPQLFSLYTTISSGNIVKIANGNHIKVNSKVLIEGFDKEIMGEKEAPVITFKVKKFKKIQKLFEKFNILPYYNASYMSSVVQFSTFNYFEVQNYKYLNHVLKIAKKEGYI